RRNQYSIGSVTSGGIAASTANSNAHIGQRNRAPAMNATTIYNRNAAPCRRPNSQTPRSVVPLAYLRYIPTSSPAQVKASMKATVAKSLPIGDIGGGVARMRGGPDSKGTG